MGSQNDDIKRMLERRKKLCGVFVDRQCARVTLPEEVNNDRETHYALY